MHHAAAVLLTLPVLCLTACPKDYEECSVGKCIKFHSTSLSFEKARSKCQSEGADLVSIHSQEENDAISQALNSTKASWVGLKCDPKARTFTWMDGSSVQYFGFSEISCTSASGFVMDSTGQWRQGTKTKYHFICGVESETIESRCEAGYSYSEEFSSCFKVVLANDTWTNAEEECKAEQGHLVSIHDVHMNTFLRRLANSHQLFDGIFIGLKSSDPEGTPSWTDGSDLDYHYFDIQMPNGIFGQCGAMLLRDGKWVSVHCDALTRLPYICTKSPKEASF